MKDAGRQGGAPRRSKCRRLTPAVLLVAGLAGCVSAPPELGGDTAEERRGNAVESLSAIRERLETARPDLVETFDEAIAVGIFRYRISKAPVILGGFGAGGGFGAVFVQDETVAVELGPEPVFMSLRKTIWGAGLGSREMGALMVFEDPGAVERFVEGGRFTDQGFEMTAQNAEGSGAAVDASIARFDDFTVYSVTVSGLSNGMTWRTYTYAPDPDLLILED